MAMLPPATEEDLRRFRALTDVLPSGCHFWTGARSRGKGNRKWYGTFHVTGVGSVRAHRYASEAVGRQECPPGHHRDHTCEFSLCVNPDHIEVVTHAENERRKQERRRNRKASGSVTEADAGGPARA